MATKLNIENLMPGGEAWWHQQSAINHPERSAAAQPAPQQGGTAAGRSYVHSRAGGFTTYKDRNGKTQMVGVPGATIVPGQESYPFPDEVAGENKGKYHIDGLEALNPQFNAGNTMPTRRGTSAAQQADTQPGISEEELDAFQQQEQEPNQSIKNFNEYGKKAKAEAQKIAEQRAGGEMNPTPKPVDRHQRGQVDETNANPDEVRAIQQELGLEGGSAAATQGAGTTYNGYDDILKLMSHNAVSDAELARRQRSREIVTGLGDTISAIANMWATTKGAPNSYDNSKGMSAPAQERYAKMLAERKAQQEQILNYYRVKRQAEQEKENQEYRNSMLEIRRQEAERRQKQADEESARKDAITKSRVERDEAAKTAAENKTLEAMGKSHLATRYNYYLEVEGRDPEEARKLAIRDADTWLEEQRKLDNEKTQSQTNKNNQPKGSGGGSSKKKKGKTHTGKKGKVYGSGKGKKRLY